MNDSKFKIDSKKRKDSRARLLNMSMKVEKGELKKFEREVANVFTDRIKEPKIGKKARHNQSLDFTLKKPDSRNQYASYT